jgi:ABC-2 type transport system ATP-binding protein
MPHVNQFALGGINELKINNNAVEFMYAGEMRALIQHLGTLNITNLSIEEPSLEEIFMHYYN